MKQFITLTVFIFLVSFVFACSETAPDGSKYSLLGFSDTEKRVLEDIVEERVAEENAEKSSTHVVFKDGFQYELPMWYSTSEDHKRAIRKKCANIASIDFLKMSKQEKAIYFSSKSLYTSGKSLYVSKSDKVSENVITLDKNTLEKEQIEAESTTFEIPKNDIAIKLNKIANEITVNDKVRDEEEAKLKTEIKKLSENIKTKSYIIIEKEKLIDELTTKHVDLRQRNEELNAKIGTTLATLAKSELKKVEMKVKEKQYKQSLINSKVLLLTLFTFLLLAIGGLVYQAYEIDKIKEGNNV